MDVNSDNNLLTSSDYEHLMDELGSGNNFESFQQRFIESGPEDPLQTLPNPPPLERYVGIQQIPEATENIDTVQSTTTNVDVPLLSFSPTCTLPCRDDYSGPLNFEMYMDSATASRRSWVYSTELRKVFIDMNKSLLIQFRVEKLISGLCVRALPVYSMADYASVPVQRCFLHEHSEDSEHKAHSEKNPRVCLCANHTNVRHVVRSTHSQAFYDYNSESDRHSVVVPLDTPQPGSDIVVVEYLFTCKTSCARGMNRKPIDVIFTLETDQGEVIGRQLLSVKICSCPKRDKEKEEATIIDNVAKLNSGKRRTSASERQEFSKKVKVENSCPQMVEPEPRTGNEEANNINQNEIFRNELESDPIAEPGVPNNQTPTEIAQLREDFVKVTATVKGLTATAARLTATVEGSAATVEGLAATEARSTATVEGLAATAARLTATVEGLAATVEGLAATEARSTATVEGLTATVEGLAATMEGLAGQMNLFFQLYKHGTFVSSEV